MEQTALDYFPSCNIKNLLATGLAADKISLCVQLFLMQHKSDICKSLIVPPLHWSPLVVAI